MGYKWRGQTSFDMGNGFSVDCKWQNTSYGFRHWADLSRDGWVISSAKCCYYNRTWERYEYQSVIYEAIRKAETLTNDEKEYLNEWTKEGKEPTKQEMAGLHTVALAAMLGDLMCDDQSDKNKWKKRMLNTIDGVDFPEDFDELDEDEKQRRLDGAIKQIED